MRIEREALRRAADRSGIPAAQADRLWAALEEEGAAAGHARFDATHVIYYSGALVIIGAMGWFMTRAWEQFGGPGIFGVASAYALAFLAAGARLWREPSRRIPAGLLLTVAVSMVPLAVYGLERWTGFWPREDPGLYTRFHPYINGSWLIMEAATVVAGLAALRVWRFPFLTAPVAYALWFMSMDLADLVVHDHYRDREYLTMLFGLVLLLATYVADLRSKSVDLSFWGYLFGLAAFWGGLTSMNSDSELSKFLYFLVNLFLVFLSLALRRKAFLVFGALGVFGYLYHLADRVFRDSLLFPVALSLAGIAILYGGLQYQRRQKDAQAWFRRSVLPHIARLVPPRALAD